MMGRNDPRSRSAVWEAGGAGAGALAVLTDMRSGQWPREGCGGRPMVARGAGRGGGAARRRAGSCGAAAAALRRGEGKRSGGGGAGAGGAALPSAGLAHPRPRTQVGRRPPPAGSAAPWACGCGPRARERRWGRRAAQSRATTTCSSSCWWATATWARARSWRACRTAQPSLRTPTATVRPAGGPPRAPGSARRPAVRLASRAGAGELRLELVEALLGPAASWGQRSGRGTPEEEGLFLWSRGLTRCARCAQLGVLKAGRWLKASLPWAGRKRPIRTGLNVLSTFLAVQPKHTRATGLWHQCEVLSFLAVDVGPPGGRRAPGRAVFARSFTPWSPVFRLLCSFVAQSLVSPA